MSVEKLYDHIVTKLKHFAAESTYTSDADEKDPLYKSYGVRTSQKNEIIKEIKPLLEALTQDERIKLAERLFKSEYGEEQSIAITILTDNIAYFTPQNLHLVNTYIKYLHGWSKIDGYAGAFVQKLLAIYPSEILTMIEQWNASRNYWERRASVVAFTRSIGESGLYTDTVIKLCNNIIFDKEDLVQKGIGWALKDNLRGNKDKILTYVKQLRKEKISSTIILYAMRDLDKQTRASVLAS